MPLDQNKQEEDVQITWPDRSCWTVFLGCGAGLMLEWIVVYGGANWVAGRHSYRVRLGTDVEAQLPFVPEAAVIYLSLFPMLWLAPFVLRSPAGLRQLAVMLAWLIAGSGIGFLVFPGEQMVSVPMVAGAGGAMFRFADRLNLTYNYLPSLHIGMAVVCAMAYGRVASLRLAAIFWLWAAAIALSTLLTHQHYLVDVVTGGALAYLIATRCMS